MFPYRSSTMIWDETKAHDRMCDTVPGSVSLEFVHEWILIDVDEGA